MDSYDRNWLNTPPVEMLTVTLGFPLLLLILNLGLGLSQIKNNPDFKDTGNNHNPVVLICAKPRRTRRQCKEIELESGEQIVINQR